MTPLADCFPAIRQHQAARRQLRNQGWGSAAIAQALADKQMVRLRTGVYALAPLPVRAHHLLRDGKPCLAYLAVTRAAITGLGKGVVADRRTSAVFYGMDMLHEPEEVELRVPHGRRVDEVGIDARPSRITRHADVRVLDLDPVPMTTAVDTVLDCAIALPMREAVVIADSALRIKAVTLEELIAEIATRKGHRDAAKWRRLLHLVDEQSGSVLESVLRFLLLTHGYEVLSQFVVHRGKLFVGRFDFCLEAARIIIECDGRRWHDPEDVRQKDRQKTNALVRLGWKVLRFTWAEVVHSHDFVLACVADCVALAA